MPWNSASPNGSLSVRANRTPMNQNTTYIETTMGNTVSDVAYATSQKDHFWNVSADLDGHHRFIKMPAFTVGGTPTDPGSPLGTGIDGMFYFKSDGLTPARVNGYFRNANYIFQAIPSFITGSVLITTDASYIDVATVPNEVYGEIFMYNTTSDTNKYVAQTGFFKATGDVVQTWAYGYLVQGSGSYQSSLKFGNGSEASGLSIRARLQDSFGIGADWNYIITYRRRP